MKLEPEKLYHVYNRGNNKQIVFFLEKNYGFFLQKVVRELGAHVDFLAYCLMPNHFHFLVNTKSTIDTNKFSNSFRILLSSYTRAIQRQENITGSLFQQNTKAKELNTNLYAFTCFQYLHQNPVQAKLSNSVEGWHHHSFNEYWKGKAGICNVILARQLLPIATEATSFYEESYAVISDDVLNKIL
jgi:putative transposase